MPRYSLQNDSSSDPVLIEIDADGYSSIATAMTGLYGLLLTEERFAIVADSYRDFEHELLTQTLDQALYGETEWSPVIGKMHGVNRHLLNFLSSARMYLDQLDRSARIALGVEDGTVVEEADRLSKTSRAEQYDASLGYRVMEALRNHVQHSGLPITGIGWDQSRNQPAEQAQFRISVGIDLKALQADAQFKQKILAELMHLPRVNERVDLKPLVRQYVSGLQAIHAGVQKAGQPKFDEWASVLADAVARVEAKAAGKVLGVFAEKDDDASPVSERVMLLREVPDRLRKLRHRSLWVARLAKCSVTTL